MLKYIWCFSVLLGVKSGSAPFIRPCQPGDSQCIKSSAQAAIPAFAAGVPALGIKPLDPMQLDLIQSVQSGLTLTFKDNIVTGMKGCIVESIKHNLNKGKQVFTVRCNVDMTGHYNLSGQLLLLPIRGQGKYKINIRDIVIKTTSQVVTVNGADGKKHWHVDSWEYASDVKTNAKFTFDNLFNGNKLLAQPVESFVNANWKDVMHEVSPPIVRAIVSSVVEAVEAMYKAVPADELELV